MNAAGLGARTGNSVMKLSVGETLEKMLGNTAAKRLMRRRDIVFLKQWPIRDLSALRT